MRITKLPGAARVPIVCQFLSELAARAVPELAVRAVPRSNDWRERVRSSLPEPAHIVDFRRLYGDIYDHYAAYDHPTTLGLQVFVRLTGSPVVATVDGQPERSLDEDLRPYWIAGFAFAQALVVSNLASGRPRLQPLQPWRRSE